MREEIGGRLRDLRTSLGLSLERMAEAASMHPKYLGSLERGEHTPTVWTVAKIASAAGVDVGSLLAGLRPRAGHPTRPAPA